MFHCQLNNLKLQYSCQQFLYFKILKGKKLKPLLLILRGKQICKMLTLQLCLRERDLKSPLKKRLRKIDFKTFFKMISGWSSES